MMELASAMPPRGKQMVSMVCLGQSSPTAIAKKTANSATVQLPFDRQPGGRFAQSLGTLGARLFPGRVGHAPSEDGDQSLIPFTESVETNCFQYLIGPARADAYGIW